MGIYMLNLLLFFLIFLGNIQAVDRFAELRKFISKDQFGIEIAPWASPILPKSLKYHRVTLDLYDTSTLRMKALSHPSYRELANQIEEVDFVGSALELSDLIQTKYPLETFDYILSSHNFEHLPNPILFLQECSKVLKKSGILSMAIPDLRACFDYFRPHTTLAEWLEAFFAHRNRPTLTQIFELHSLHSRLVKANQELIGFYLKAPILDVIPYQTLKPAFDNWSRTLEVNDRDILKNYVDDADVHCSTFTPTSFELLIYDLQFLGLINFSIKEISSTNGCEFYVHLCNDFQQINNEQEFYNKRAELLRKIVNELKQR